MAGRFVGIDIEFDQEEMMGMNRRANRQPKGVPVGGQFAASPHEETDADLSKDGSVPGVLPDPMDEAETAAPEKLWRYVTHTDRDVRIAAATNPRLSRLQIGALSEDGDWQVRWVVANLPYAGVAQHMSTDKNPIVREAASHGWDLPESTKEILNEDVEVQRIIEIMSTA